MDKNILIQYADMIEEIKDLRERIKKAERELQKIQDGGTVVDTVKGGAGGIQHFKVEGFPTVQYGRKKRLLIRRMSMLEQKEEELLVLTEQANDYINSIHSSELRMLFRMYYIDGLSWVQTARKMKRIFPKRKYTADSCRMKHNRYFDRI